ncbi:MAG: prepilin-type N-terminal cleavage/methylation domain-containing protein [Clostridiales bacterium]|jgi:prepilin-type N-terminal cleavage/methylation domain-containing protein|nr:prepilin-type N-terminal cleavage/methylation domain-containing protein [Clostridiales bacterium]
MNLRNRIVSSKLNNDHGFSLTELLAVIAIMSLVTLAIAAGAVTAVRVYKQVSIKANAQTLLATSITAMSDEFEHAVVDDAESEKTEKKAITIDGDKKGCSFLSEKRGVEIKISNNSTDGIYVNAQASLPLVTKKTNTYDLYTEVSDISVSTTGDLIGYTISVRSASTAEYPDAIESQRVYVRTALGAVNKGE